MRSIPLLAILLALAGTVPLRGAGCECVAWGVQVDAYDTKAEQLDAMTAARVNGSPFPVQAIEVEPWGGSQYLVIRTACKAYSCGPPAKDRSIVRLMSAEQFASEVVESLEAAVTLVNVHRTEHVSTLVPYDTRFVVVWSIVEPRDAF